MPTMTVKVHSEVPDRASEQDREAIKVQVEETWVLALWKTGELSTQRAAEKLRLTSEAALNEARRKLITGQPGAGCLSPRVIQGSLG
jgi:predicted DNA-binding protein (UPF0251 family)